MGINSKYNTKEERKLAKDLAILTTKRNKAEKLYRDLDLKIVFIKAKLNELLYNRGSIQLYGSTKRIKKQRSDKKCK